MESKFKKKGCLFYAAALLAICVVIAVYSYAWIPAVGFIIYFAVKKDANGHKKRNIIISAAIMATSLIVFASMNQSPTLTDIDVDWGKTSFDISDTVEVKITPVPSNADIETLELSKNEFAELDYTDGKAVITFKKAGEASLFFTANGNIDSSAAAITITDKAAEQAQKEAEEAAAKKAEEEAAKKAEEEAKAKAEQETAEKAAAEQAAAEQAAAEQAAAEQAAAEQAAAEQAAAEQAAAEQAAAAQAQQNTGTTVYWTPNGKVYHSTPNCPSLSRSKTILSGSIEESGKSRGCKNCY